MPWALALVGWGTAYFARASAAVQHQLREEVAQLKASQDQLLAERDQAKAQVAQLTAERDQIKAQVAAAQQELTGLKKRLEEAQEKASVTGSVPTPTPRANRRGLQRPKAKVGEHGTSQGSRIIMGGSLGPGSSAFTQPPSKASLLSALAGVTHVRPCRTIQAFRRAPMYFVAICEPPRERAGDRLANRSAKWSF